MVRSIWLLCVLAALGAYGCGDDGSDSTPEGGAGAGSGGGGGGGGSTSLGVDGSVVLSELSASEAEDACNALADSINVSIGDVGQRALCVVTAYTELVFESGSGDYDVDACKTMADACVAAGPQEDPEATAECTGGFDGCSLTAADLDACVDAGVAGLESALGSITCESLVDPQVALDALEDFQNAGEADACKTVTDSCANLDIF